METKEKKKEGLYRLFEIAGQKKGLLFLAGLLSAGRGGGVVVTALGGDAGG